MIAQMLEHCTTIAEIRVTIPVQTFLLSSTKNCQIDTHSLFNEIILSICFERSYALCQHSGLFQTDIDYNLLIL